MPTFIASWRLEPFPGELLCHYQPAEDATVVRSRALIGFAFVEHTAARHQLEVGEIGNLGPAPG